MKLADGKIKFGDWLPDQPDLDNPGLTEAVNVVPVAGTYRPFQSLSTSGDALAARPRGAIELRSNVGGTNYLYAGTAGKLYRQNTALGTWTDVSGAAYSASTEAWEFALDNTTVIATNYYDVPQKAALGSGNFSTLATSGTAPNARRIGKVGQFVLLGDTNLGGTIVPHRVQWAAIDDPTNWQTPGTAAAIAVQAGEQNLDAEWGSVNAIVGGDQFGIIMQAGGLSRVTYEGGNTVFRFDKIAGAAGLYLPHSVVEYNGLWHYISRSGVWVTDGVRAEQVGLNKADRYLINQFGGSDRERVYGALDAFQKCIFWCYPTSISGAPDKLHIFNVDEKRFSRAEATCEVLVNAPKGETSTQVVPSVRAFNASNVYGTFSASSFSDAYLTTAEQEFYPGGRTNVQGVKPLVVAPAANVSVAVGYRDDQIAAVTYTSETTPHTRTGVAGFRVDARYVRARVKVTSTGSFASANGLEFEQSYGGAA